MIFRIIDDVTGEVVNSLNTDIENAMLYLKSGQSIYEGGEQLAIDNANLVMSGGVLVRKPGTPPEAYVAGEGEVVTRILI